MEQRQTTHQYNLAAHIAVMSMLIATFFMPAVIASEPLHSHNMHPLYTPLAQFQPMNAAIQQPHSIKLSLLQSYGNNFFLETAEQQDSEVIADLDSETAYTSVMTAVGLTRKVDLHVNLLTVSHFPGVLDGFIQWYHGLFHFPNADRDLRRNYQLRFFLQNEQGALIDESRPLFSLTALRLESRFLLFTTEKITFSASILTKIPLRFTDHPLDGNKIDAASRLFFDYSCPPFLFSGSIGTAFVNTPSFLPQHYFNKFVVPYFASAEWLIHPNISMIVTINGNTSAYETGYYRADQVSSIINSGVRFSLGEHNKIQLSMGQEIFTYAATDVAIHCEWSHQFDF